MLIHDSWAENKIIYNEEVTPLRQYSIDFLLESYTLAYSTNHNGHQKEMVLQSVKSHFIHKCDVRTPLFPKARCIVGQYIFSHCHLVELFKDIVKDFHGGMFVPIFCCLLFDTIWCYVEVTGKKIFHSGITA